MASHPKFDLTTTSNNQFRFDLTASNGQTILNSETYTTKSNALNGIDSVKTNAPYDNNYKRLRSVNNEYYFNLLAQNGQVIGTSETYQTSAGMENGIDSVKTNAPIAEVEDNT